MPPLTSAVVTDPSAPGAAFPSAARSPPASFSSRDTGSYAAAGSRLHTARASSGVARVPSARP